MGLFGTIDQKDLNDLRTEIFHEITRLAQEISYKSSDSEEIAKTAAANIISIEGSIKNQAIDINLVLNELQDYKNQCNSEVAQVNNFKNAAASHINEISSLQQEIKLLHSEAEGIKSAMISATSDVSTNVEKINEYLERGEQLAADIENVEKLVDESKKINENINSLLSHSIKNKERIDDLYNDIYGVDVEDEEGNNSHVEGIKDELEKSYKSLSENIGKLGSEIKKTTFDITEKQNIIFNDQKDKFENLIKDSYDRYNSVDQQLTGLLPGAMAAGLSAAYETKKDDEIVSLEKFDANFRSAIRGMIGISLIPFLIDIYLLVWGGKQFADVIRDTPNIVAMILPLYFPILWMAYSSNKKYNLSKRLIEEYTHKSVLGKTFSGLSNQIETLSHQSGVKEELRTRLLFNVLQVSAENPGKLITNYNKADHPLMEALENSVKLADSIGKLSRIPGFSTIAKKLSTKSDEILKGQEKKVKTGLETQESLEEVDIEDQADPKA